MPCLVLINDGMKLTWDVRLGRVVFQVSNLIQEIVSAGLGASALDLV